MRNPIRVWRCEEDAAIVRALENLQELAARGRTEIDEYEAEEKHVETRYIQEVTAEGTTNVEQ